MTRMPAPRGPREMPKYKKIPSLPPIQPCNLPLDVFNKIMQCRICKGLLREPSVVEDCGDVFCKGCIYDHFRKSIKCPACDMKHSVWPRIHHDKTLDYLLKELTSSKLIQKLIFIKQDKRSNHVPKQTELDETPLTSDSRIIDPISAISSDKLNLTSSRIELEKCEKTTKAKSKPDKPKEVPKLLKLKQYRNTDPLAAIAYSLPDLFSSVRLVK